MKEFYGHNIPAYAILSHLWGDDEVLLSDMKSIKQNEASAKGGFAKIELCCKQAKLDGWDWAWVDTCCIDKTSSAELAEAIYSMFQWYSRAMICYAYLADVAWDGDRGGEDEKMFHEVQRSRWFKRGWTLQELIAPKEVRFFDKSWSFLGSKSSWAPFLEETTRIPQSVLGNAAAMRDIPVGQRMIWAFDRETTREEDLAYCLLGIFDINMPLLYGEGPRAFWRLQEEIMKHEDDHTLFLWDLLADSEFDYGQDSLRGGLLARSPRNFRSCPKMSIRKIPPECPWPLVSNRGVQIGFHLKTLPQDSWSLVGLDNGRHNWVEIRSVQLAALCCQIDDSSNLQPWPLGSPPGETVVALVLWQPAEAGPGVFHRYPGRYVKVRVSEVMQCWKLTSCLILNPSPPKDKDSAYGVYSIETSPTSTNLASRHGKSCINIWEIQSGYTLISTIKVPFYVQAQPRSRDNFIRSHAILSEALNLIAITSCFGHTLEIWNWAKRKKVQSLNDVYRWAYTRQPQAGSYPLAAYREDRDTIDLYPASPSPTSKKPFAKPRSIDLKKAGLPHLPKLPELAYSATGPLLVAAAGPRPPRPDCPPPEHAALLMAWQLGDDASAPVPVPVPHNTPYKFLVPDRKRYPELENSLPLCLATYGSVAVSVWSRARFRTIGRPGAWQVEPVVVTERSVLVWDFGGAEDDGGMSMAYRIPDVLCCVSPDCRFVAYCDPGGGGSGSGSGGRVGGLVVLDATSGRELWRIDGRGAPSDGASGRRSGRSSLRSGWSSEGSGDSGRGGGLEGLGEDLGRVTELAFSGDGGLLFVGSVDGGVIVYEVREGIGIGVNAGS
ncbi:hypothetical protein SLS53_007663 [Cytospora paraplurivora]|uniref:Heterokaryon incompatibility domain-containing protein n=1 Tax=Cytospora paraplurivora TaxID=2898453 RepID=A0AAN9U098_9PEZI